MKTATPPTSAPKSFSKKFGPRVIGGRAEGHITEASKHPERYQNAAGRELINDISVDSRALADYKQEIGGNSTITLYDRGPHGCAMLQKRIDAFAEQQKLLAQTNDGSSSDDDGPRRSKHNGAGGKTSAFAAHKKNRATPAQFHRNLMRLINKRVKNGQSASKATALREFFQVTNDETLLSSCFTQFHFL